MENEKYTLNCLSYNKLQFIEINFYHIAEVELMPFFVTTLCCLFIGLEIGIVIGIVFNILMILATTARPKIDIDTLKVLEQNQLFLFTIWSKSMILNPDRRSRCDNSDAHRQSRLLFGWSFFKKRHERYVHQRKFEQLTIDNRHRRE